MTSRTRSSRRSGILALVAVAATVLGAGLVAPSTAQAIVGGEPAASGYPFMGSLQRLSSPRDDLHVCGVTLLAPRWALTAGHCTRTGADVIDRPTSGRPRGWRVRFGSPRVGSGGQLVPVARFVQLNNRYFDGDLALLELARPVTLTPAVLAETAPAPGTPVRIMGWGQTCHDPISPACSPIWLRTASTAVQPPASCNAPDDGLCIGSADGSVGPENMDSGGPAVTWRNNRWELVGAVEGGAGEGAPAIYTSVARYRSWILGYVEGRTAIPAPTLFPSRALRGTAQLNGCSGAVVRSPRSRAADRAMLLTNGHCVWYRPAPGRSVAERTERAPVQIKDARGETMVRAHTSTLVYATMTGTDLAVYRLDRSYRYLRAHGVKIFSLAAEGPRRGRRIQLLSAGSGRDWTCTVARVVPRLREGGYQQRDSIRYAGRRPCAKGADPGPDHGDSGAPVVDRRTGQIVAIHATGNDQGLRCRADNPCEVDRDGTIHSLRGRRYAQQTADLRPCLARGSRIDLDRPGCNLP